MDKFQVDFLDTYAAPAPFAFLNCFSTVARDLSDISAVLACYCVRQRESHPMTSQFHNHPLSLSAKLASFDRALTAKEVAALLACDPDTIYKRVADGDIPYFRLGTLIRFDPQKLCERLERQTIDLHGEIQKLRNVRAGKR